MDKTQRCAGQIIGVTEGGETREVLVDNDGRLLLSARRLKENNEVINIADILDDVYDESLHALKVMGGGGVDRELVVQTYIVKTAFTGASVGDTITCTQIINVTNSPTTVLVVWRNQTTATDLAEAPASVNLTLVGSNALTNAELRATALAISAANLPLPTGASTEAKQDATNTVLTAIRDTAGIKKITDALPAGTNRIGQTGYTLRRVSTSFVRPSDTTPYATGDAVTNSTSSPTVFQLDLSSVGAVNGQSVEIRKIAIVSSTRQATLPLFNVYLSATTFAATNDNAALDIDDTTMEAGGAWFACDEQNFTVSNSRVAKSNTNCPMILAAADTKFYGVLQAANAYTPVSGEKFTIIAWVALL